MCTHSKTICPNFYGSLVQQVWCANTRHFNRPLGNLGQGMIGKKKLFGSSSIILATLFFGESSPLNASIPIQESVSVCNANKLPLFAGVFSTPPVSPYYRITTVHVQRTHSVVVRIGSTGTRVQGLPNLVSPTIVWAALD